MNQKTLDRQLATLSSGTAAISGELEAALKETTPLQLRFAVALFYAENEYEACRWLEISESKVRDPEFMNGANAILILMKRDYLGGVLEVLKRYALEAAMVKVAGLKSTRETTRQKTATEVLNRTIGRPGDSSSDGQTVNVLYIKENIDPKSWDEPQTIDGDLAD